MEQVERGKSLLSIMRLF